MRISDWSSDVCSSDLLKGATLNAVAAAVKLGGDVHVLVAGNGAQSVAEQASQATGVAKVLLADGPALAEGLAENVAEQVLAVVGGYSHILFPARSEEHTSELQSLMRISYAVFCLKKKKNTKQKFKYRHDQII